MKHEVLILDNVCKKIKGREIVKNVSFSIDEGKVLGFLGSNGAGKSTTLRMIVGLSKPTSGSITICGYSITKNYIKAMTNVGCIIEGPDLYNYMSGMDNLEMLASMCRNVTKQDIMNAVEMVHMQHRIKDKISTYSLGMKQRMGLAQALIHHPKLLVLDEPTNGLDPSGISEFRNIIKNLAHEENISVLISSHLISEIELMCDKVSIIKNGNIIKNAWVEDLTNTHQVFWVVDNKRKAIEVLKKTCNINAEVIDEKLFASINPDKIAETNSILLNNGLKLQYVGHKSKNLEDLFLKLTENEDIV